jgi:hypothetical protein
MPCLPLGRIPSAPNMQQTAIFVTTNYPDPLSIEKHCISDCQYWGCLSVVVLELDTYTSSSHCTVSLLSKFQRTTFLKTRKLPIMPSMTAGANQPVHWFLGGKGLGIQQGTSVWVGSPKFSITCSANF